MSFVWGQGDASKKLDAAVADYKKKSKEARDGMIAEYSRRITSLKTSPGFTASARKDKIDAWTSAKKLFEEQGKFPAEDEFAEMEMKYWLAMNRAFIPAARVIDDTINQAIKTDNKTLADEAQDLKAKLETRLLGSNSFTANSKWQGNFARNKEVIPFHLYIGNKTNGGSFKGHVEDNPGVAGNWSYDVEGQTSGLGVEFAMTKSTRGKFQQVKALGVISGDRIILEVTQTTGGKPTTGLAILHRK